MVEDRRERILLTGDLPSPAEVSHAHMRDPELTVEEVERQQREALIHRLD